MNLPYRAEQLSCPQCWLVVSPGDLSWALNRGLTPSVATGPEADHTTDSISGSYLYLESSNSGQPSKLYTPEFDLTTIDTPVVSFWYHMFGATMGSLDFQVRTGQGSWLSIARLSGQQHYSTSEGWKRWWWMYVSLYLTTSNLDL
ncbi:MAG: hypothetical protein U5L96_03125 [Owenweeksia sp.]|nr:hypothetical protein [Owenweeksia sp.]